MTGTHQHGQAKPTTQSDPKTLEFVPKEELDRALEEVERLRKKNQRLQREVEELQKKLEAARRGLKRQTAPFSRRKRKARPQPNGRKSGAAHGQHHRRPVPESVNERYVAPLPERCACGGPAIKDQIKPQYQEEIVRHKIVRQFDVEIGHCACCGKRLQGRHALQTSDALDAAQVQLGPEALTLAVHLTKQLGISYGNAAAVLRMGYGMRVSRGGLCRAVARLGRKVEPTYQALVAAVRQETVVWMDETGWKVDAVLRWMWVAVSPHFTVYAILEGRGFAQASALIGADYAGGLEHDGWSVYYQFAKALHQSCVSHIVRRCRDLVEIVSATAAAFPLAVLGLLEKALALRDRYQAGEISLHGQWTAAGRIEAQMDRLS
jgi:transposase